MEELDQKNEFKIEDKRPVFLLVLCILSYVAIGLSLIINLFQLISGPLSKEELLENRVKISKTIIQLEQIRSDFLISIMKKSIPMAESINASFYSFNLTTFIGLMIGLFGVINMYKGKKIGFHLYIIYSLISVGQLYLFISPAYIPTFSIVINLILSGIFIFMYSRNLKWMK